MGAVIDRILTPAEEALVKDARHLLTEKKSETFEFSHQQMVTMGEHCSMTERRADEATRDSPMHSNASSCWTRWVTSTLA